MPHKYVITRRGELIKVLAVSHGVIPVTIGENIYGETRIATEGTGEEHPAKYLLRQGYGNKLQELKQKGKWTTIIKEMEDMQNG